MSKLIRIVLTVLFTVGICSGMSFALDGTDAPDVLIGPVLSTNEINGLGGNDIIIGLSNIEDNLNGGTGRDIIVSTGIDPLNLSAGTTHGGLHGDLIFNLTGVDNLYGDEGDDVILTLGLIGFPPELPFSRGYQDGGSGSDFILAQIPGTLVGRGSFDFLGTTIRAGNGDDVVMGHLFGPNQVTLDEGDDIVIINTWPELITFVENTNMAGNAGVDGIALVGPFSGFTATPSPGSFGFMGTGAVGRVYYQPLVGGAPWFMNIYGFEYLILPNFQTLPI
jgi:hypothetical protein